MNPTPKSYNGDFANPPAALKPLFFGAALGDGRTLPQEFPLIASEALISSSFDSFILPALVVKARKQRIEDDFGWGLIVGVDPAGMGPDRTSIAWRRGRRIMKVESRRQMDTMEVAAKARRCPARTRPRVRATRK
jgi:hypothetical protein